ncbi:hypothetical protein Y1Q_0018172 [Alligator mississippiensis]|uniref:Uncharacterized protein n=1 Tax=Alligator mississippiensis TaxID=8496 RepID=A0A151MRF4_ALLMI|nr:hypothetical protein Y1Q_0018172 [Alligator mississippiensis]
MISGYNPQISGVFLLVRVESTQLCFLACFNKELLGLGKAGRAPYPAHTKAVPGTSTLVCGNQSWKKCPGPPLVNCSRATSCCANIGESLDIWISSSITRFDFCKCNASRCWLAYTFSKVTSVNYTNDFQGQATVKQGTFHAPEVSKGDVGSYRFFNMDDNTCLLKVDIELPGAAVWPSCTILLLLLSLVTSVVF